MFRFFTEDSNILLCFTCLLYIIFAIRELVSNVKIPKWVKKLRFISTTAVTTTFMVVLLFLAPYTTIAYKTPFYSLFSLPNMFFTHFICPILSTISFIFFEEVNEDVKNKWKDALWVLTTVLTYAVVVGTLASNHLISSDESVNNVYGFMDVTAGKWWYSPLAFFIIIGGTYLEGALNIYLKSKVIKRNTK